MTPTPGCRRRSPGRRTGRRCRSPRSVSRFAPPPVGAVAARNAATSVALLLPRTVPQMAVALAAFGLALAPFLAVTDEILARSTPAVRLPETYGWLQTAGQLGIAAGSATSGVVNDHLGNTWAFLVVVGALALALIVALSRRRTLRLPSAAPQAETVGSAVPAGGSGFGRDDAG
ncbi:MFS transporter [Micromonospora sp. NPDC048986]|uniref:MFS transporter n=1 Tax=Micromonospora sp. NPDC048986 TaxID=3155644 RepID=UPI0033C72317